MGWTPCLDNLTVSCDALSNLEVTGSNLAYNVDATSSTYKGMSTGATSGRHRWVLAGNRNTVDLTAQGDLVTLQAGPGVTINGDDILKSATGNSWNAYGFSLESYDPLNQDFALTWSVESITGTIREMVGLDDNPQQNQSYSSIEHALYQVGSKAYSRVYESGSSVFYGPDTPLLVGDRLGVRVESGVVTYFVKRGATIIDLYTSTKILSVPVFAKAALSRGAGDSGNSLVGDLRFITKAVLQPYNISFEGGATELITDEDKELLRRKAGLIVRTGSTYSNWSFDRENVDRYNGLQVEIDHAYIGVYDTSQEIITF